MSSIDELLAWLDQVVNDADLALRDEQAGMRLLTAHLDEGARRAGPGQRQRRREGAAT